MERHVNKFVTVWALALTAFITMGLTIPNTFVSGTTINAAEMNANFAAVKSAVDALEARLQTPGTIVGMARVSSGGVLTQSWMANGGVPSVAHVAASGRYDITWPGEDVNINNRGAFACTTGSNSGWASVSSVGGTTQIVYTYNTAGAATDDSFWTFIVNSN